MRLPPTKLDELREVLRTAGRYDVRNELLIKDAVRLGVVIERVEKALDRQEVLLRQTGSQGQEKVSVNPLIAELGKLVEKRARVLWYLGLGNRAEEQESGSDERGNLLDKLMEDL